LGIPTSLSATILATMAVLFAATTMDTGVRLQRFVVQEAGELAGLKVGKFVATLVVLVLGIGLCFGAGADGSGGMVIWPLFGTTNQLMAALTLSILAVILTRKRRPTLPILIPMVFVGLMTLYALVVQLGQFYTSKNWLLFGMDLVILVASLWVLTNALGAIARARKEPAELEEDTVSVGESGDPF